MEKPWLKPKIENGLFLCLCCSGPDDHLCLTQELFGDGVCGFTVNCFEHDGSIRQLDIEGKTLADIEALIKEDDSREYRCYYLAGLHDETYQRHERNKWVLIEKGPGYA